MAQGNPATPAPAPQAKGGISCGAFALIVGGTVAGILALSSYLADLEVVLPPLPGGSAPRVRTVTDIPVVPRGRSVADLATATAADVAHAAAVATATAVPTPLPPQTFEGTGKRVAGPFPLKAGLVRVLMGHNGARNFIVWLLDDQGNKVELLAAETGAWDGEKAMRIKKAGQYLLDIDANGSWLIGLFQ